MNRFYAILICLTTASFGAGDQQITKDFRPISALHEHLKKVAQDIRYDGQINLTINLPTAEFLSEFLILVRLRHELKTNHLGDYESKWDLTGLNSYIRPDGIEHLLWKSPEGAFILFDRSIISNSFDLKSPNYWIIRRLAESTFEILSRAGQLYRYKNGRIVSASTPAHGTLLFETRGGLVTCIHRAGASKPILIATYDDAGNLLSISSESVSWRLVRNGSDQLISISRNDTREIVAISYRNNLVFQYQLSGLRALQCEWSTLNSLDIGERGRPFLLSDGTRSFAWSRRQDGIHLKIRASNGEHHDFAINPKSDTISLVDLTTPNSVRLLFSFISIGGRRNLLKDIRDGRGVVLESYDYNQFGMLQEISRDGVVTSKFHFNNIGLPLN